MSAPAPWSFSFEPLYLLLSAAAVVAYVRAARRYPVSRWRRAAFATGILLIAATLNSPLETISDHYLLLIHLLQNAMIADWAPPLMLLGLSQDMRLELARRGGRLMRRATEPAVALPLWLAAWYGVHVPTFYDWALRLTWPLNLEHAILITAGLIFWWPLLEPPPRRLTVGPTLAYLGIAFFTSPWLSLALIFTTRPLYSFYVHVPRLWGMSVTEDQNLGGVLMNAELTLIFFVLFAYHLLHLLAEEERIQRELDAQARVAYPAARPDESKGAEGHG
jgi:cytochrome c oxidase assembly factor CtaG